MGLGKMAPWYAVVAAWVLLKPCFLSAAPNAQSKSCLWRVESDRQTVYIQGSLHLLKPSEYPLPKAIEDAFAASEILVLEVDLATAEDPAAQAMVLSKGILPAEQKLSDFLNYRTRQRLAKRLGELGISIDAFERFKPWFVVIAMTEAKLRELGFSAHHGVDWHFFRRARKRRMPIEGLETLEFQLSLFDRMSKAQQSALVEQTLRDLDTIEKQLNVIVGAWRTGDLEKLEETLLDSFSELPDLEAALITRRNKAWMTQIEKLLKGKKTAMVVVGAGHLPGPDGLLDLLRSRGFRVEQL